MKRRWLLALWLCAGCATSATLQAESRTMREQLEVARGAGAYTCSPEQLAQAETELEFLDAEIEAGNSDEAITHRDQAKLALTSVVERQKGCKPPEVGDGDNDGILDENDVCPELRGTAATLGCPDQDADGVADQLDDCTETPEDANDFEDEDGCPDEANDKDGDGILDKLDRCKELPETKNGLDDEDGCPDQKLDLVEIRRDIGKIEIKQKVYFDTGNARIKPVSFLLLDQVSEALLANPTMRVLVEGHTDSVGADAKNLQLSDDRAASVRQYLLGKGLGPERLNSQGFGETKPIESNRTARGREMNRRVEFTIVGE